MITLFYLSGEKKSEIGIHDLIRQVASDCQFTMKDKFTPHL